MILHHQPDATGAAVTVVMAGRAVIHAFHVAAALSLAGIVGLLMLLLGNWRDTALVLLPLILAGILTAATTVAIGMDFNFANIIVLPLMVGLGVASGIHLVLRDRELTSVDSVLETSTPRAVIVSALTTIFSFGTLMLSGHKGVFSMGLLLTIGISLNLFVTLVVLPALLALRRQRREAAARLLAAPAPVR
jgi:predicted RND superfamily exporter protein